MAPNVGPCTSVCSTGFPQTWYRDLGRKSGTSQKWRHVEPWIRFPSCSQSLSESSHKCSELTHCQSECHKHRCTKWQRFVHFFRTTFTEWGAYCTLLIGDRPTQMQMVDYPEMINVPKRPDSARREFATVCRSKEPPCFDKCRKYIYLKIGTK